MRSPLVLGFSLTLLGGMVIGDDFLRLDEALPSTVDILPILPLIDFDENACFPAAAISRTGDQNPGLELYGSLTEDCRETNFLDLSNTLHRQACEKDQVSGDVFCGHMFGLYFEKDQLFPEFGGHTNDWEHVLIWTKNGEITHASFSAHGNYRTKKIEELDQEDGKVKFVYYKDGVSTHAMRFARNNEVAENPYGRFVTPVVTSWNYMVGDGVSNQEMRQKFNTFDYGSAHLDAKDSRFYNEMNAERPEGYPEFIYILFW